MGNTLDDTFTEEEVSQIINIALQSSSKNGISRQELMETGLHFGLQEEDIAAAIEIKHQEKKLQKKKQRHLKGFRYHLFSYVFVMLFLVIINTITPGPWWFQWPLLGWGTGVFFHFLSVSQIGGRKKMR